MNYVLLAEGFEEVEAITIVDVLRRAQIEVTTVGIGSKTITGTHGIPVVADMCSCEAKAEGLDMVILPGGMPGTTNLGESDKVAQYVDYCVKNDKYVCAICAAPMVLGKLGVLEGKNAVCYPGCEGGLTGANIVKEAVVVDGKVVTSMGPGTATEFALKIVELVKGKAVSDQVRSDMLL